MYKLDFSEEGVGTTLNDMIVKPVVRKWHLTSRVVIPKGTKVYFERHNGSLNRQFVNKIIPLDSELKTTEYTVGMVSTGGIRTASGVVLVGLTRYKIVNEVYGMSNDVPYTDTPENNKILKDFEDKSKATIEKWQQFMIKMYFEEIEEDISKIRSGTVGKDLYEYSHPPLPPMKEKIRFKADLRDYEFIWDFNLDGMFKTISENYIKVDGEPDIYVEIADDTFV